MRLSGLLTLLSPAAPTGSGGPTTSLPDEGRRISLDRLEKGQCGVVVDLELAQGDDNRLRTLGICPGRRVWLIRKGDPMVVRVMNSRLGLAKQLAQQVTLEVGAAPCSIATDVPPEVVSPQEAVSAPSTQETER